MMNNTAFEYIAKLQYKVKTMAARLDAFEAGEKYVSMKAEFRSHLAMTEREIKRLKLELGNAYAQMVTNRKGWMQVFDDMEKGHAEELLEKDRIIKELVERALKAERIVDEQKGMLKERAKELYQIKTELEEEKGKVLKLKSQISRDHENSSAPSSLKPNRKKITNNREKTGRRPGGQPGHEGHKRKRHIPTSRINIPAPKAYTDNPIYKPTGKTISKQLVDIRVEIIVNEYCTPEFRHVTTRQRVHADFPEGLVDEVNYGSNLRAFAFLLNNHCNVSVLKVSDFLSELTGGKLRISAGMINGLPKVYAQKTKAEQNKAFADLLLSPVVNFDFSSARVNGQKFNVAVCATPSTSMYFARERKGHEGIAGTPIEHHQGILVHDHDKTLYSYGSNHQECSDHILRYLLGSMQNEPKLKWSQQMRGLFQEMIHFRKSLDSNDNRNPDQICPGRVDELEAMYDEILNNAKAEYEYEPPSKYYMDGINLYKRLDKYKANHLLFLHDKRVPHSNSLSERLLRIFKRKQAQAMTFRSYECLDYLCQSLGAMASYRAQGCNLYESTASVFSRTINRDGTVSN
jgi:hypothetical protein